MIWKYSGEAGFGLGFVLDSIVVNPSAADVVARAQTVVGLRTVRLSQGRVGLLNRRV